MLRGNTGGLFVDMQMNLISGEPGTGCFKYGAGLAPLIDTVKQTDVLHA
jgi:hypothetical protein